MTSFVCVFSVAAMKIELSPSLYTINVLKQCYSHLQGAKEGLIYNKLPYRRQRETHNSETRGSLTVFYPFLTESFGGNALYELYHFKCASLSYNLTFKRHMWTKENCDQTSSNMSLNVALYSWSLKPILQVCSCSLSRDETRRADEKSALSMQ